MWTAGTTAILKILKCYWQYCCFNSTSDLVTVHILSSHVDGASRRQKRCIDCQTCAPTILSPKSSYLSHNKKPIHINRGPFRVLTLKWWPILKRLEQDLNLDSNLGFSNHFRHFSASSISPSYYFYIWEVAPLQYFLTYTQWKVQIQGISFMASRNTLLCCWVKNIQC